MTRTGCGALWIRNSSRPRSGACSSEAGNGDAPGSGAGSGGPLVPPVLPAPLVPGALLVTALRRSTRRGPRPARSHTVSIRSPVPCGGTRRPSARRWTRGATGHRNRGCRTRSASPSTVRSHGGRRPAQRRAGRSGDRSADRPARRSCGRPAGRPADAAFFARDDYYDVLARLRAEDPVHECAPGFWAVTRYEDIRDLSRDPHHFCSGRGALANDPIRAEWSGDARAIDPPHGPARACGFPRVGQPAVHATSTVGPRGVRAKDRVWPARRSRGTRRDRLRLGTRRPVPARRDRGAAGDRRGGPGGLPTVVRCGDRVARPAAGRDDGGARGALRFHRGAHPDQARAAW